MVKELIFKYTHRLETCIVIIIAKTIPMIIIVRRTIISTTIIITTIITTVIIVKVKPFPPFS